MFRTVKCVPVSEYVSLSDEGPLLETLELFTISNGGYQLLNYLPNLALSMQYRIFFSAAVSVCLSVSLLAHLFQSVNLSICMLVSVYLSVHM